MSLKNSAYLEQMRPVSLGLRGEAEDEKHVHGFTDIIFIPASPPGATTMPGSESEGQTAYVDALAPDWPNFIHESWMAGYLDRYGTKVGWRGTAELVLKSTDGGRGRILDAVRKIPIWAQRATRPRPAISLAIRLCRRGEGEKGQKIHFFSLSE